MMMREAVDNDEGMEIRMLGEMVTNTVMVGDMVGDMMGRRRNPIMIVMIIAIVDIIITAAAAVTIGLITDILMVVVERGHQGGERRAVDQVEDLRIVHRDWNPAAARDEIHIAMMKNTGDTLQNTPEADDENVHDDS